MLGLRVATIHRLCCCRGAFIATRLVHVKFSRLLGYGKSTARCRLRYFLASGIAITSHYCRCRKQYSCGWIDFSTAERGNLGNNIATLSANWLNPTSDSRKLARIYSTPTLIVHQRSCHPPLVLLNHLLTPDHDAGSQHA